MNKQELFELLEDEDVRQALANILTVIAPDYRGPSQESIRRAYEAGNSGFVLREESFGISPDAI